MRARLKCGCVLRVLRGGVGQVVACAELSRTTGALRSVHEKGFVALTPAFESSMYEHVRTSGDVSVLARFAERATRHIEWMTPTPSCTCAECGHAAPGRPTVVEREEAFS